MTEIYYTTSGDVSIAVHTITGGDLHIKIVNIDNGGSQSIYLRNGEELAKGILKEAWK